MATAQAGGDAGHGPGAPEPDDPVPPGVAGIEPGLPRAALGAGLGLLAEGASDVVYLVRSDGIVEWVSPSVTRVLGWQPADLVGSRPWFVVHAETASARPRCSPRASGPGSRPSASSCAC